MACTCPHHVHPTAGCNHMAAVEHALDRERLDNFFLEDETGLDERNCNYCSDLPG